MDLKYDSLKATAHTVKQYSQKLKNIEQNIRERKISSVSFSFSRLVLVTGEARLGCCVQRVWPRWAGM